jgi:O-acetyl-ADP-ribose deacetylase (regulator of RNase III)
MLHFTSGNMFELPVDLRVNTVNCVGVMGAGVALAFKTRHPAMFRAYQKACDAGEVRPGALHIWHAPPEWIINFPTKRHWRENSKYEDIEDGLKALRTYLDSVVHVVRIALPALGCGHGGLDWARVSKLIEHYLATTTAEVFVFEPADSRRAGELTAQQKQREDAPPPPAPQLNLFGDEAAMVPYPASPVRLESIEPIGPPHTRPVLVPPSSFPMPTDSPPSTKSSKD